MSRMRTLSFTCVLILCISLSGFLYADDANTDNILEFGNLAKELKAFGPMIAANEANRQALRSARTEIADVPDALSSQRNGITQLSTGLYQLRQGLEESGLFQPANPLSPPSYQDLALKQAMDAMLNIFSMQVSAQSLQLAQTDAGYIQGGEMSANLARLDDADMQITMGGYRLFAGFWKAERTLEELKLRQNILEHRSEALHLSMKLGLATELQQLELEQGITELEQGIQLAELEQRHVLIELNLMLGRNPNQELILGEILLPSEDMLGSINSIDYDKVWSTVYKQNHGLRADRFLMTSAQTNFDESKRLYGEYSNRTARSKNQKLAAELTAQLTADRLEASYSKTYARLQLYLASYQLEQARASRADTAYALALESYALGRISSFDLLEQQHERLLQINRTIQAGDDLTLAYQCWLLIAQGMNIPSTY